MSVSKESKPKTKVYNFSEVAVLEWDMIGVKNGRHVFAFEVICEAKRHLGVFSGTTRPQDGFVMAIKSYPDILYDVEIHVTPAGNSTLMAGRSFLREDKRNEFGNLVTN